MSARTGKIARLPFELRNNLNTRLREGELGTKLVEWLNGLPKVKEIMDTNFGGRPINEQNLTEWRQGGYEDWLRHEEARTWVSSLVDEAAELEEEAGDFSVADWHSAPLGVALGRCLQAVAAQAAGDPKQMRALLELNQEIGRLRRGDHNEQRLKIERERWHAEQAAEAKKNRPDPLGSIFGQLNARIAADFLKEDFEKHGGVLTPDAEALLLITGRLPATRKEPDPPANGQTESK